MEHFFVDTFGVSESVFSFFILPLLIFFARITDVSINTIRIIYVLGGRRLTATVLGFFESFVWLMAIRQIFEHLDNWVCYVAYPGGFACGIFVGMMIEERIAYGKVIVRIITRKDLGELMNYLNHQGFRFTHVHTTGPDGQENLVFTVLPRESLEALLATLKRILPTAFYTVEKVNRASDPTIAGSQPSRGVMSWLSSIRRE
jgi:uncharacterized protein YebE (UPF0316 family)